MIRSMTRSISVVAASALAMLLAGCGETIVMRDLAGNVVGIGDTAFAAGNHGEMSMRFNGDDYDGEWVLESATEGDFGFVVTNDPSGLVEGAVVVDPTGDGAPALAKLEGPKGAYLNCRFQFGRRGECTDHNNQFYDLEFR